MKAFKAMLPFCRSVMIYPGQIEFTRMFSEASSLAITLVSMITPALDTLYAPL